MKIFQKNKQKTLRNKEPSLLRKLITIYYEQAVRRKALRLLSKQMWSVDFLTALVVRAATQSGKDIVFTLTNKDGIVLTIASANAKVKPDYDDSIFNHLDDDIAVNDFIRRNSTR